jgi:ferric-dicitrate binding protein FerR (iron transport regulator)
MKTKDPKIKAEDILTDDSMSTLLNDENFGLGKKPDEELKLAKAIRDAASLGRINFDQEEKNALDKQIIKSIQKTKRKRVIVWTSAAAVFFLFIGLTILFEIAGQTGIRNYTKTGSQLFTSAHTKLVLSGQKEIEIVSQESEIVYSSNGTQINIKDQNDLSQPVLPKQDEFNTLIVPYGKRSRVTLPDNTIVWLNSGSKLIYPVRFTADKREVFLEGEAIFEVSRNEEHPFFVLTNQLDVKVLGTVFNLSAYNDDKTVKTVLETGSVELRYKSNFLGLQLKKEMIPGTMAVYDPSEKSIVQTKVNTENHTSWKDGYFIFDQQSLEGIAKKLSRYYNVPIEFEDPELASETFTGYLDLRESAMNVMYMISEIVDIEAIQENNKISIRKKGPS